MKYRNRKITQANKYRYIEIQNGKYGNSIPILMQLRMVLEKMCSAYRNHCDVCHIVAVFERSYKAKALHCLEESLMAFSREKYRSNDKLFQEEWDFHYLAIQDPNITPEGLCYYHVVMIWPRDILQDIPQEMAELAEEIRSASDSAFLHFYGFEDDRIQEPYKENASWKDLFYWLSFLSAVNNGTMYCFGASDLLYYQRCRGRARLAYYTPPNYNHKTTPMVPTAITWGIPEDSGFEAFGPFKMTPKAPAPESNGLVEEIFGDIFGPSEITVPKIEYIQINKYIAIKREEKIQKELEKKQARARKKIKVEKIEYIPTCDIFDI